MGATTQEAIRDGALHLLKQVAAARQAGSGVLDLDDLVGVTGAALDADLHQRIAERGPVHLTFVDGGPGTFHNEGLALTMPVGPVKLLLPARIAGRVVVDAEETRFEFDLAATITGKLLFMEMKLQRLEVSEHHVAVRMPGGVFDQEFTF